MHSAWVCHEFCEQGGYPIVHDAVHLMRRLGRDHVKPDKGTLGCDSYVYSLLHLLEHTVEPSGTGTDGSILTSMT